MNKPAADAAHQPTIRGGIVYHPGRICPVCRKSATPRLGAPQAQGYYPGGQIAYIHVAHVAEALNRGLARVGVR